MEAVKRREYTIGEYDINGPIQREVSNVQNKLAMCLLCNGNACQFKSTALTLREQGEFYLLWTWFIKSRGFCVFRDFLPVIHWNMIDGSTALQTEALNLDCRQLYSSWRSFCGQSGALVIKPKYQSLPVCNLLFSFEDNPIINPMKILHQQCPIKTSLILIFVSGKVVTGSYVQLTIYRTYHLIDRH